MPRGRDLFVFQDGRTQATITDFQVGIDKLEILNNKTLTFKDVHISAGVSGVTVIDVADAHITLVGVRSQALSGGDFIFSTSDHALGVA